MPDSIDLYIKNIQSKLQLLLKKYALLSKENEQLKKENQSLQTNEKTLIEKTEQLQQQVNILKISAGQMEGKEKMQFEKNINRYIRSIDKCIGILNK
jgi:uncharacterized protein (DUF3084 family)